VVVDRCPWSRALASRGGSLLLLADVVDGAGEGAHHFFQTIKLFGQIVDRSSAFLSRVRPGEADTKLS
jgi:hypothetical protein